MAYQIGPYRIHEQDRPHLLAALLWIILFFAATSGLARVFVKEEDAHTAKTLRLAARPLAVFAGKLLFNLILLRRSYVLHRAAVLRPDGLLGARVWRLLAVLASGAVALSATSTHGGGDHLARLRLRHPVRHPHACRSGAAAARCPHSGDPGGGRRARRSRPSCRRCRRSSRSPACSLVALRVSFRWCGMTRTDESRSPWALGLWMLLVIWAAFFYAPSAPGFKGESARIVFFHVPQAWVAVLAFCVNLVASLRYLRTRDPLDDARAAAAAAGSASCSRSWPR